MRVSAECGDAARTRVRLAEGIVTVAPTVVVPPVVWVQDYFRPERVHMRETCDGLPRMADTDYGRIGLAACSDWLGDTVVADPEAPGLARCDRCAEIVARLGGIV